MLPLVLLNEAGGAESTSRGKAIEESCLWLTFMHEHV